MLAGEREHKASDSKLFFSLGQGSVLVLWTLPTAPAATQHGDAAGPERGKSPVHMFHVWLYGSWASASPLPHLKADSNLDFSPHLNSRGICVIHLFCGTAPVLLSLLILC